MLILHLLRVEAGEGSRGAVERFCPWTGLGSSGSRELFAAVGVTPGHCWCRPLPAQIPRVPWRKAGRQRGSGPLACERSLHASLFRKASVWVLTLAPYMITALRRAVILKEITFSFRHLWMPGLSISQTTALQLKPSFMRNHCVWRFIAV